MMRVEDFYRLELHWELVDKNKDRSCNLHSAFFSGPVLTHAQKIRSGDSILLDLTPQYSKIMSNYYFTRLVWGTAEYRGGVVYLSDVMLTGEFINSVSKLSNDDYILIDTSRHDGDVLHMYNLVYRAAIMTNEGKEYRDV